jgi:predicted flap endonuclease-1-like 5' DNA nuclease
MNAKKPSNETFRADLKSLFDTLQDETVASLGWARELQLAARALIDLEAARLAHKLGADAPRVRALKAQAAGRTDLARAIDVEAQIAAVRVPQVANADTLLHGRITDNVLNRVTGVTVQLVDVRGQPVEGVKEALTDAQGYYAFVLKPEQAEVLAGQKLALAIVNDGQQLKPAQPTLSLVPGTTLVQEVKLSDAELSRLHLRVSPVMTATRRGPEKEAPVTTSTPLEHVRGIGPVRAERLRAAGIPDLEAFLRTDMTTLVKIMGFNAHVTREDAKQALKTAKAAKRTPKSRKARRKETKG